MRSFFYLIWSTSSIISGTQRCNGVLLIVGARTSRATTQVCQVDGTLSGGFSLPYNDHWRSPAAIGQSSLNHGLIISIIIIVCLCRSLMHSTEGCIAGG